MITINEATIRVFGEWTVDRHEAVTNCRIIADRARILVRDGGVLASCLITGPVTVDWEDGATVASNLLIDGARLSEEALARSGVVGNWERPR